MTEQQFKRRVKAITKALQTNDIRVLSIKDCRWLLENYWLRPQDYWDLMYDWERYSRKDFEKFYKTFGLLEWISGEIDLNHALTWILHWIERKQGNSEDVKKCLENFKQRCRLVHEVRNNIGLKTYHIHYLYSSHRYKRNYSFNDYNVFRNSIDSVYACDEKQAIKDFFARYRPSEKDLRRFKIRRIRKVNDRALYLIQKDPRMTDSVFKYLTDDSILFDDPTFHWQR